MSRPGHQVIIVGAGMFGAVAGALATREGFDVTYVDDGRDGSGSKPAAGLVKPSWLNGFGDAGRIGLDTLDKLFGLQVIPFHMPPLPVPVDVNFISPQMITRHAWENVMDGRVTHVGNGSVRVARIVDGEAVEERLEGLVLLAAGVWVNELLPIEFQVRGLKALMGSAFYWHGTVEPYMNLWAPYKQIKVFNIRPDLVWAGDSTGMSPKTYTKERHRASQERCAEAVMRASQVGKPVPEFSHTLTGSRPVVQGEKQGVFRQVYPRTWVSTGGGKMGAVLAGYHATQFLAAILEQWSGR